MSALARGNAIAGSTAYAYRDEAVAARALLADKAAGHSQVIGSAR